MIIGVSGFCYNSRGDSRSAGAGKDEVAKRLVQRHKYARVAFADPLKRICKEVYDFSDEQLWGPSSARNAPDHRYPNGAEEYREAYAKQLKRAEELGNAGDVVGATEALASAASYEREGWLTPRLALQLLGTEWGRRCYRNTWVDYAMRVANTLLTDTNTVYTEKGGLLPRASCFPRGEFDTVDSFPNPIAGVVIPDLRFRSEFKALKEAGGICVRVVRRMEFEDDLDASHVSERELGDMDSAAFDYVIPNNGSLHDLGLHVDRMLDVLAGRIRPYDDAQADVPPALRR